MVPLSLDSHSPWPPTGLGVQPGIATGRAPTEAVSLAVVPFRNASGDPALNGWGMTLAEILRAELGQSTHLRTVPAERLRQVLRDFRLEPESEFDEQTLRRLGEFSNAQTIVWGQYPEDR